MSAGNDQAVIGLSSAEVNALPQHVRDYIMWLETSSDQGGVVQENFRLTEENAGLRSMIAEVKPAAAQEAVEDASNIIELLLALAYAAWSLADNADGGSGNDNVSVDRSDFDKLSKALDALDELPDDQPGYVMEAAAKARWALRGILAAPVAAAPVDLHVDCWQCARCNHAGINDNSDQLAACLSCEWSGNSPDEDHCPECDKTGCMGAACPKCGARYTLIAEAELKVSATEAPEIDEAKLREALRKARIQQLYVFENSEIDSLVRELCDTSVAKVGIDACTWAGDGEGNWHTACGEIFTLMEGSPADNKMHHCPYCGKNLMTTGTDVCVAVIGDSYEDTRSEAHDAARYRWLRNHYEPSFHDSECDSLIGLHGEDLDDYIDDEMQATSAEVGL